MKKKRILFIMHMPPPVHGAAMKGNISMDSFIHCDLKKETSNGGSNNFIHKIVRDALRVLSLILVW